MPIDEFQRLGLALAIGLLVGVERGWHARDIREGGRTAGLRTFTLIGLLGGISGELAKMLGAWAFAAIAAPFAAAFIVFKLREQQHDKDYSVTAVVAALTVFALGAYAVVGDGRVAAAAGVVMTILLAFKEMFHRWVERLSWEELRAALVLLAMSLVALPVLPNRDMGLYGIFNPYDLWLLSILLAGVSFAAYAAVKLFGQARGLVLAASVGALVSSTASTVYIARRNREAPEGLIIHTGAALLVGAVMAARIGAIVIALAPSLLTRTAAPVVIFIVVSAALAGLLLWRGHRDAQADDAPPMKSPFELKGVLQFTLLLGVIMAASKTVQALFGAQGLLPVAAIAGLVDVDAITLTVGRMASQGLDPAVAASAVLLAAAVNTLSKTVMGSVIGGRRFGILFVGGSLAALIAAALVWWWSPFS